MTAGCASVFFTLLSPSGPSFPVATDYFEWSIQWYEKSILQNKMWAWLWAEMTMLRTVVACHMSVSLALTCLMEAQLEEGNSWQSRPNWKIEWWKERPNKNKYPFQLLTSHISIIALQGCYSFLPFLFWDKSINLLFYEQTPIGSYSLCTHCVRYLACNYISEISY